MGMLVEKHSLLCIGFDLRGFVLEKRGAAMAKWSLGWSQCVEGAAPGEGEISVLVTFSGSLKLRCLTFEFCEPVHSTYCFNQFRAFLTCVYGCVSVCVLKIVLTDTMAVKWKVEDEPYKLCVGFLYTKEYWLDSCPYYSVIWRLLKMKLTDFFKWNASRLLQVPPFPNFLISVAMLRLDLTDRPEILWTVTTVSTVGSKKVWKKKLCSCSIFQWNRMWPWTIALTRVWLFSFSEIWGK